MSREPLISICIPTYDRGPVFDQTIESVIGQTYTNWELIISDDASSFDIHERLKHFADPRIRIIKQPKNLGIVRNFNAVIAEARGEIIKPLCDDDALHPQCLEVMVREIGDRSFVVIRDIWYMGDSRPEFAHCDKANLRIAPPELTWDTTRVDAISPTNIAFTRELWRQLGPYDEELGFAFDYDFTVRAKAAVETLYILTPMCIFRCWPGSTTVKNRNPHVGYPDFLATVSKLWAAYPQHRRMLARRVRLVMLHNGASCARSLMHLCFKYASIYFRVTLRLLRYGFALPG